MAISERVRGFLAENHRAVLTTFRKDGGLQMSIVTCGLYQEGPAFTVEGSRAKLKNLQRDPRCAILVSTPDWSRYVGIEGAARLISPDKDRSDDLRQALREVYRAAAAKEHPDWEEYDRAMIDQRRSAIVVVPERLYGTVT